MRHLHNPEQGAHHLPDGSEEKALVNPILWQAISFTFEEVEMAQERLTVRKIREIT